MEHVKVYDPAVCCSTGVCSPDSDVSIAQFTAALDKAKKSGVIVDRFTLAHQPEEYVSNVRVKGLLDSEGIDVLPVVFVGDEIISKGGYPSRGVLFEKLGFEEGSSRESEPTQSSCCAPNDASSTNCCS